MMKLKVKKSWIPAAPQIFLTFVPIRILIVGNVQQKFIIAIVTERLVIIGFPLTVCQLYFANNLTERYPKPFCLFACREWF